MRSGDRQEEGTKEGEPKGHVQVIITHQKAKQMGE